MYGITARTSAHRCVLYPCNFLYPITLWRDGGLIESPTNCNTRAHHYFFYLLLGSFNTQSAMPPDRVVRGPPRPALRGRPRRRGRGRRTERYDNRQRNEQYRTELTEEQTAKLREQDRQRRVQQRENMTDATRKGMNCESRTDRDVYNNVKI